MTEESYGGMTWRNARLVIPWTSFLYVGYQLTNHYHAFPTHTLPLTAIDRATPFMVWTVVPYFALIGGMYLFLFLRSRALLMESMVALTVAVLVNYGLFFFYPTVLERPPVPTGDGVAAVLYRWLIGMDSPANCFPSGHITVPALACWYLARQRVRWRWAIASLYGVLSLSVLTTKQHYAVDIAGGLATAALGIWVAARWRAAPLVVASRPAAADAR